MNSLHKMKSKGNKIAPLGQSLADENTSSDNGSDIIKAALSEVRSDNSSSIALTDSVATNASSNISAGKLSITGTDSNSLVKVYPQNVNSGVKGKVVGAYIPYDVAKKHINKVLDDMSALKKSYKSSLEEKYQAVEDESQQLFNKFFHELQGDYREKVKAFSGVIKTVQDTQKKNENQWRLKVESMRDSNTKLVNEVNELIEFSMELKRILSKDHEIEMDKLRMTMSNEQRRIMSGLQARESVLKESFHEHVAAMSQRYMKKSEILQTNYLKIIKEKEVQIASLATSEDEKQRALIQKEEQYKAEIHRLTENSKNRLIEEKKKSKQVLEESRREEQEKLALFQAEVKERQKKETRQLKEEAKKRFDEQRAVGVAELEVLRGTMEEELRVLAGQKDQESQLKEEEQGLRVQHEEKIRAIEEEIWRKEGLFEQSKADLEHGNKALLRKIKQDHEAELHGRAEQAQQALLEQAELSKGALAETRRIEKERLVQLKQEFNEKLRAEEERARAKVTEEQETAAKAIETMAQTQERQTEAFKKEQSKMEAVLQEKQVLMDQLKQDKVKEIVLVRAQEAQRADNAIAEKESELTRLEEQHLILKADWQAEKQLIEEEYERKVQGLIKSMEDNEQQIQFHEAELAKYKAEAEETMKRFEKSRRGSMVKIQSAGGQDKVELEAGLEELRKSADLGIRSSLDKINFHESKRQILVGEVDRAEVELKLVQEEKEETKAEAVIERNERMKSIVFEREATLSEINLMRQKSVIMRQKSGVLDKVEELRGKNSVLESKAVQLKDALGKVRRECSDQKDTVIMLKESEKRLHETVESKLEVIQTLKGNVKVLEEQLQTDLPKEAKGLVDNYKQRLVVAEGEIERLERHQMEIESGLTEEKFVMGMERKRLEEEIGFLEQRLEQSVLEGRRGSRDVEVVEDRVLESEGELIRTKVLLEESEEKLAQAEGRMAEIQTQLKQKEKELKEVFEPEVAAPARGRGRGAAVTPAANSRAQRLMEAQVKNLKSKNETMVRRVADLEKDCAELKKAARTAETAAKKAATQGAVNPKDAKKLELTQKTLAETRDKLSKADEALAVLEKAHDKAQQELGELRKRLVKLEGLGEEVERLRGEMGANEALVKQLQSENGEVIENYNSERVLRKKYYNIIEDMKGKIRVYCRSRPMSGSETERGNYSVILSPDEFTLHVQTKRGVKEFAFDQVFTPESRGDQDVIFEDVERLIQSAVDGYNVCIFAYGQTGSGKTWTMIGVPSNPGISPRAFDEIFKLLEENKKKFSYSVSVYMLELYNDALLDLFVKGGGNPEKLDIKKDKKGMVFIQNAVIKEAKTSEELNTIFNDGSKNRHVASTKMNSESSRSHLIIGVVIKTTNLVTGAVLKGKLSLVDLAGSERSAKTGATNEQLKEAQSINKSLSALGDVIQALSTDQNFIPYRNNKLTMVMQDSLGGNAKTLMFVNISPADYNTDETVVSLTYAARVKMITNSASKNADNKEITRLKGIISKLKKGEDITEED